MRCNPVSPLVRLLSVLSISAMALTPAYAVLTDNLTIVNAKAISLGNAVTADPPGVDSIHFNPAGLAKIKGRESSIKVYDRFYL